jgi:hypothetical protein
MFCYYMLNFNLGKVKGRKIKEIKRILIFEIC